MGWKNTTLAEVCEINPGKKEFQDKSKEMEVSFLPMASVSEDGKIIAQEKRKLKEVIKGYTNFRDGDVLLAKITPCFENGKRAIAKDLANGIGFGSTEFHVLRPGREVTSDWIFHAISRSDFCNIAKSQMTGTAGQKRVPTKVLEQFKIPIPPIKEQEKISENIETQFTRLDVAIKSLKIISAKLELYRKSILKDVFSNNRKYDKLGNIFHTTSGGTPSRSNKKYYSGTIPWLKSGELNDDMDIKDSEEHVTKEAIDNSSAKEFPPGTVLVALYGATTGKLGILRRKSTTNQAVCGIFPKEGYQPKFIFYYLLSKRLALIRQGKGGAQPNISQAIVRDLEVPLIGEKEQQGALDTIEAHFSVIGKVEEVINHSLDRAEKLRRSILKSAFEGRLI